MTLHWQKVKYYVLHTQMISILLYLTAKPLLHASQPDKIIGTTRSTPGQSVFDNVCFVPDSKRHSDKFKRYFEDCFWTRKNPRNKKFLRRRPDLNRWILVLQTIAFCSRKAPILCFLRLSLKINHPITTLFCHLNSKCQ